MKDKVTERIRELVPELKELSLGCEVIIEGCTETTRFVCEEERRTGKVWCISGSEDGYGVCPKPEYVRIIGHPIHLQHVILAIKRHLNVPDKEKRPLAESAASCVCFGMMNRYTYTKPFDKQSPELYKFLAEILL